MLCWAAAMEIWTVICKHYLLLISKIWITKAAGRWFFYAQLMAFPFITAFLGVHRNEPPYIQR